MRPMRQARANFRRRGASTGERSDDAAAASWTMRPDPVGVVAGWAGVVGHRQRTEGE